jgi:phosphate starvation-inducible PhoH-like protein
MEAEELVDNIVQKSIHFTDNEIMMNVFGNWDENLKIIEEALGVSVTVRDNEIKVSGNPAAVDKAVSVIENVMPIAQSNDVITKQNILYFLSLAEDGTEVDKHNYPIDCVCVTAKGLQIKSKTFGQKQYVKAMKENTVTFGIGPAGTGKTFLAVAMAVSAFRAKEVDRIILTRPAVEAGEKLGFLPGDLQHKVDPYLRPLYDALYFMLGPEQFHKHQENGAIEVAPLAYMRGRTLDTSYIILDEAQNTTPQQMKMFLTRIGFGSKAVVTGDITQIDLDGKRSGLVEVMHILKGIEGIAFVHLTEKDVVRHELIQKIIKAYEKYEQRR